MTYEAASIPPWEMPANDTPKKKPTTRQIRDAVLVLTTAYPVADDCSLLIARQQGGLALIREHFIKHCHVNLS